MQARRRPRSRQLWSSKPTSYPKPNQALEQQLTPNLSLPCPRARLGPPGSTARAPACPHLIAAVGVDVHGGEEAGLGGVRVDPAQRVQPPAVLRLKDVLLVQRLRGQGEDQIW